MHNDLLAKVAHEVNRAYCQALGDTSQLPWNETPSWQKESAIHGVEFHRKNPNAGPESSHNEWMAEKISNGWKWGPEKDGDKKEHPCLIPYEQLPLEQQAKDYIFKSIVDVLKDA